MYLKNPLFNPFNSDNYYFFEFGSVPKKSRNEFRDKLLKRRGAENQKNLILFDSIELLLKNNEENKNINIKLASELNCSLRMLDCHKSRLLKQLRKFHFKCHSIPGESEIERIDRKIKLGMLKEAKNDLIENEKKITSSRISLNDKLFLFYISEKLIYYYSYCNDFRKTRYYFKKAEKTMNSISKTNAEKKIKDNINIRYIFLEVHKLTANRFKLGNLQKAIKKLESLRTKYPKSLNTEQILKIHHRLGQLYYVFNEKSRSKHEFTNALEVCKYNNLFAEKLVNTSFLILREFAGNNSLAGKAMEFHKKYFNYIIENCTDVSQIMDFEYNYLRFLIYSGDPNSENITIDFINRQILYSRKSEALNSWYLELSDELSSSIVIWDKTYNRFVIKTDKEILTSFIKLNKESIFRFKNIYSPNILSILYINLIEQEFWNARNADFLKTELYIKKLKRIVKLHNINISFSWIETTALGLEIFEFSKYNSTARIISKFSSRLKILTGRLTSKTQTFNLSSDYAKLLFIKQELEIDEFSSIITDFENEINRSNPDLKSEIMKIVKTKNS